MKIRRLGIVANVHKEEMRKILADVAGFVPAGVSMIGPADTAALMPGGRIEAAEDLGGCDAVIALGGDGTFLRAARLVERVQIPVLGIKVRSLGFLTEDDPGEAMRALFSGRCAIQDRMRLEMTVDDNGAELSHTALNDVVVHGAGVSRVLHLSTYVDGVMLGEYCADGVIVSTPTGSTAYSLAAGGPIINPVTMEAFVLTPLSPHSLSVRPVVVGGAETLTIELIEGGEETLITIDGQQACGLLPGRRVIVRRSRLVTRLLVAGEYNFYDLVRRKLQWGGVLRRR
ncbi:MAG: NAD(+)/NADH kinase [Candidatus Krumholzibacteria bacterium]|nr:NAD(+)/NADH kinase [Candidatus Krumholzibacteria bacterium]